uniref:Uncharacterized protein n=1 Tax=Romanomermis culicivorax TaxID=13658 RepID=A0A915L3X4_ROMCU
MLRYLKLYMSFFPVSLSNALSVQQRDVSLQLEPNAPWENFLSPAPTVITLLGQLMVLSTTIDFPLNEQTPIGGFKYVRNPGSFRASLVQISNDGWSAFHTAHKNMDKIQLYMQQIPSHVKTALKLIVGASPPVLRRMLPITLESIRDIGTSCVQLAIDTEHKYLDVMLLQGEILEATLVSKNIHDERLESVKQETKELNIRKESLSRVTQDLKNHQEKVEADVKKYQTAFDKAIKDIPTGWKAIAQDLCRAAVDIIRLAPNFMGGGFGIGGMGSGKDGQDGSGGGVVSGAPSEAQAMQTSNVLAISQQMFDQVGTMKKATSEILNQKATDKNPSGLFGAINEVSKSFQDTLSQYSNLPVASKLSKLVQKGQDFCSKMMNNVLKNASSGFSEEVKKDIMGSLDDMEEKLKPFSAAGAYASAGSTVQDLGQETQVSQSTFTGKYGNERFKAYMQAELLKDAQRRYDDVFAEIRKTNEQMENLMVRMSKLNFQERNYEEILKLIREGVRVIGLIREQWSKLVSFFTAVSTRAEVALQKSIVPFVKYLEAAQETILEQDSIADREFFKGMFLTQTTDIHKIAFFLYTLSSTYVDISSKYLLDRLAGLAVVLASNTDVERQQAMTKLGQDNSQAQNEIKRLGEERRLNYKTEVEQRIKAVEDFVAKLGGPSPDDRALVKKGIDAVKKASDPKTLFDIDIGI